MFANDEEGNERGVIRMNHTSFGFVCSEKLHIRHISLMSCTR